jgi:hypothetical protein
VRLAGEEGNTSVTPLGTHRYAPPRRERGRAVHRSDGVVYFFSREAWLGLLCGAEVHRRVSMAVGGRYNKNLSRPGRATSRDAPPD